MKICHIITTIEYGGAEKQLLILCKNQVRDAVDVHVIFVKGNPQLFHDFEALGITIHDFTQLEFINQVKRARKLLLFESFKLIHAHLPRAEILARLVIKKEKLVISRHNSEPFYPRVPRYFSWLLSNYVIKKCDALVCISHSVKSYLEEIGEIVCARKVYVVHYGLDFGSERIPQKRKNTRRKSLRLVAIGRLEKQKDYPTLIQGLSLFSSEKLPFTIDIFGVGQLEQSLNELVHMHNLQGHVRWRGKIEEIEEEMRKFDVMIHASIYEGFGMIYLEASKAGLPVLTSRNDAAVEIFGSYYPGFFTTGDSLDLASKLIELTENDFLELLQAEQESIRYRFDEASMWKSMKIVYSDVLT